MKQYSGTCTIVASFHGVYAVLHGMRRLSGDMTFVTYREQGMVS